MAHHTTLELPPSHSVTLRDGRTLGYLELGDPDGVPVISNHGGLSCRLDVLPCADAARRVGARVISPDRPGIGTSDRRADPTLSSWADDVAELADALGIGGFTTMGWSFGGGYAQALAHHLSDRVEALALVASCVPPDWDGMREQINRMDRHFLAMSERPTTRAVERTIFHLMHLTATELPSAMASRTGLGEGDAEVLTTAIAEGLRDVDGVVGDYRVMDRPWGFDPSSIRTPTTIWQGDADDLVPAEWGERLQQSIPDATLVKVPGGTHYLWYQHWEDILGTLTRHP